MDHGWGLQKGRSELVDGIIAACKPARFWDIWSMIPTGYWWSCPREVLGQRRHVTWTAAGFAKKNITEYQSVLVCWPCPVYLACPSSAQEHAIQGCLRPQAMWSSEGLVRLMITYQTGQLESLWWTVHSFFSTKNNGLFINMERISHTLTLKYDNVRPNSSWGLIDSKVKNFELISCSVHQ